LGKSLTCAVSRLSFREADDDIGMRGGRQGDAFGPSGKRKMDGLAFQKKMRSEW
jgi:hypothetical protein